MYTSVKLLPTKKYKEEKSKSSLQSYVDSIEDNWQEDINNSNSDYRLYASVDWDDPVFLMESDRESPCDARRASAEFISNNLSGKLDYYDAILVRDSYDHSTKTNGCANGGNLPGNGDQSAGANNKRIVCYVANHSTRSLEDHEIGHLHGAYHAHHDDWGSWEYTIMGNDGDPQCSGGSAADYKYRASEYNTAGGCTVSKIRQYMEQWNHENGSFS